MILDLKLRKVGNSLGIILPKEALAHLQVQEGDLVSVTEASDGSLRMSSQKEDPASRQMAVAKDLMKRYSNTLRELAK